MSRLLATKLHRPSLPPRRVRRPHLIQRLSEGLESGRRVTLVSAPAGFGKTTCISEWLDTLDYPVAWLSLDAADDDPGRLFTYLVTALQQVDDRLGLEIVGALRAGQVPPHEIISTTLINDIVHTRQTEDRFLLILDDVHLIQDLVVLQVFADLVANVPPPLHLVLITREDPALPLARLRANNQLTEIRAEDLRFTGREAGRFLDEVTEEHLDRPHRAGVKEKPSTGAHGNGFSPSSPILKKKNLKKISNIDFNTSGFDASEEEILAGMEVEHQRFGKGKVLSIEGFGGNKKATVFFPEVGQKQLLLKFARLKVLK